MHSGADLSAAIDGVLGYDAGECKGEHALPQPEVNQELPSTALKLCCDGWHTLCSFRSVTR